MSHPVRASRPVGLFVLLAVLVTVMAVWSGDRVHTLIADRTAVVLPDGVLAWPSDGQSALSVTEQSPADLDQPARWDDRGSSGGVAPHPIASLAKVMTAYLVLQRFPIAAGQSRFHLTVTAADVADTSLRRSQDQSLVSVAVDEELSEWQALEALMLPSANNVAAMLATRIAGSQQRFVVLMNHEAAVLGMSATHYTDPSGFDSSTVSTPYDQMLLARRAMQVPAFRAVVAQRSARLPVAGRVRNTNGLLGHDGVVGLKTGSDDAAGGCLIVERDQVLADGRVRRTIAVVMGQRHGDYIGSAERSARTLIRSAG